MESAPWPRNVEDLERSPTKLSFPKCDAAVAYERAYLLDGRPGAPLPRDSEWRKLNARQSKRLGATEGRRSGYVTNAQALLS